jgi:hypothetical protein
MATSKTSTDQLTKLKIAGEGFDEEGHRHFKLKVKGSDRALPPYSMSNIIEPKDLFRDLSDAGCNLLTKQHCRTGSRANLRSR